MIFFFLHNAKFLTLLEIRTWKCSWVTEHLWIHAWESIIHPPDLSSNQRSPISLVHFISHTIILLITLYSFYFTQKTYEGSHWVNLGVVTKAKVDKTSACTPYPFSWYKTRFILKTSVSIEMQGILPLESKAY